MYTPDACQYFRSAPQKHPIPTTIISRPSGKGARSAVPSTSWVAGTGISRSRPGSAVSGETISVFLLKNPMRTSIRVQYPMPCGAGRLPGIQSPVTPPRYSPSEPRSSAAISGLMDAGSARFPRPRHSGVLPPPYPG